MRRRFQFRILYSLFLDSNNDQQIYNCELEQVREFGGFKDWAHTFDLIRGKKDDDDDDDYARIAGKFKVSSQQTLKIVYKVIIYLLYTCMCIHI